MRRYANTHIYTSEKLVENFSGRVFEILAICKFDKKEILKHLPKKQEDTTINSSANLQENPQANIVVRNFPLSVEEFRKKTGIRDGGEIYIFAVTDLENNKIVIISKK